MVYIMDRVKRAFWLVRGSLWLEYRCTNDVMRHHVLRAQITKVVYGTIHNPQLLDSLWRRANARNVSFQCDQFTLSTQLINPNFHKAKRFHLAVRVYSDNTQKTSNVVRTSVTLLACGRKRTSLFLPRFYVIIALSEYTCTAKNGIYLLTL